MDLEIEVKMTGYKSSEGDGRKAEDIRRELEEQRLEELRRRQVEDDDGAE